jgi:O-methyltransferase/aklanonic acid methyltransferase
MGNEQAKARIAGVFAAAAPSYDQSGVPFFAVFAKALVDTLAPAPDWHVVDVGSGRGAVVFALAPHLPTGRITAIDLAAPMVQALRADLEARGVTGVDVQVGDVEALNFDDGSADAVTASMVLFFLPDLDGGLRQIRRVLKPGGVLAFSVFAGPDPAWIPVYDAFVPYLPAPVRSGDLSRPSHQDLSSPDDIRQVVEVAGFDGVEVSEVNHDIRFESVEQWHAWSWSIGLRGVWAGMDEPVREQARAAVLDEVQRLAQADGSIVERFAVRYVRALAAS